MTRFKIVLLLIGFVAVLFLGASDILAKSDANAKDWMPSGSFKVRQVSETSYIYCVGGYKYSQTEGEERIRLEDKTGECELTITKNISPPSMGAPPPVKKTPPTVDKSSPPVSKPKGFRILSDTVKKTTEESE